MIPWNDRTEATQVLVLQLHNHSADVVHFQFIVSTQTYVVPKRLETRCSGNELEQFQTVTDLLSKLTCVAVSDLACVGADCVTGVL